MFSIINQTIPNKVEYNLNIHLLTQFLYNDIKKKNNHFACSSHSCQLLLMTVVDCTPRVMCTFFFYNSHKKLNHQTQKSITSNNNYITIKKIVTITGTQCVTTNLHSSYRQNYNVFISIIALQIAKKRKKNETSKITVFCTQVSFDIEII